MQLFLDSCSLFLFAFLISEHFVTCILPHRWRLGSVVIFSPFSYTLAVAFIVLYIFSYIVRRNSFTRRGERDQMPQLAFYPINAVVFFIADCQKRISNIFKFRFDLTQKGNISESKSRSTCVFQKISSDVITILLELVKNEVYYLVDTNFERGDSVCTPKMIVGIIGQAVADILKMLVEPRLKGLEFYCYKLHTKYYKNHHYIFITWMQQEFAPKRTYNQTNNAYTDPVPHKKKKTEDWQYLVKREKTGDKESKIIKITNEAKISKDNNNQGDYSRKFDEAYFQRPFFGNIDEVIEYKPNSLKIQQQSQNSLRKSNSQQFREEKIQQGNQKQHSKDRNNFIKSNSIDKESGIRSISRTTKTEYSDPKLSQIVARKVDTTTDKRKNRYPISIREVGDPTSYHEKNILVTKNVDFVPVDLYFSKREEARVLFYQKAFYSITLSQSNLAKDDNKFFIIQVLLLGESPEQDNYYLFTRWGRVGVVGQKSQNGPISRKEAIRQYHSKSQSKVKKGNYKVVDVTYDQENHSQSQQIDGYLHKENSSLPEPVQQLVKLIFDIKMMHSQMKEIGYDQKRSPLGLLAKASIEKGYIALDKIMKIIKNETVTSSDSERRRLLNEGSSEFYSAIPHDFGYMNMQAFVLSTEEKVKQKLEMLSSLVQIQIYSSLMKEKLGGLEMSDVDIKYLKLKCHIAPLHPEAPMHHTIVKYIQNTHGKTHDKYEIELVHILSLRREEEEAKYREDLSNKMLLWHGSRLTNYVGILSEGLKIAPYEAPVTGYMFGKGIYFTDIVSKSANYCHPKNNEVGLMLLCEVALGEMNDKYTADYNAHNLPPGKNSTRGVGKYAPSEGEWQEKVWIPNGPLHDTLIQSASLLYNEYAVYNRDQIKCRYIVKVKFRSRV